MEAIQSPRLTELSSCAGCAAKLGQALLREMLVNVPRVRDRNLLVGADTLDDAAVYRLPAVAKKALVQTVDFFTPIVDDPYAFGQIAATNALSDVYAMGGRPLTALNLLAVPADRLPARVVGQILRGGASKAKEAGCALVGGHTIRSVEPIYGLSVTGLVDPRKVMTNAAARVGDLLVLTKRLGTGIATTGIKRGLCPAPLARAAIASMCRLNHVGATLAERGLVKAATDVTGFGLFGHLASMCRASGVSAQIDAGAVPLLSRAVMDLIKQDCIPGGTRTNHQTADAVTDWGDEPIERQMLMCDAQTSGGLLLCVPPRKLNAVLDLLKRERTSAAAVIGRIVRRSAVAIVVR